MKLNFSKYSKLIKILSVIPIALGLAHLAEYFLPEKQVETYIVSKSADYRAKFDTTTYNIRFENNNDQFTEDIFNALEEGDEVTLKVTFFSEEVNSITKLTTNQTFENSTSEIYFRYLFTIIFLIPLLYVFKKRSLSAKQSKYIAFIIVFSLISLYRIIKLNLN